MGDNKKQRPLTIKDQIYEEAKALFEQRFVPMFNEQNGGACVYWTLATAIMLRAHGYQFKVGAGSMQWYFRAPDWKDDGVSPTHWGYVWSPNEIPSVMQMLGGGIPEMHSWCWLPITKEIVDFSTAGFKTEAIRMGFDWQAAEPPRYLWGRPPDYAVYEPNAAASKYVAHLMVQIMERHHAKT